MALVTPRLFEETRPALDDELNNVPHTKRNPSESASGIFELPSETFDVLAVGPSEAPSEELDRISDGLGDLAAIDEAENNEQNSELTEEGQEQVEDHSEQALTAENLERVRRIAHDYSTLNHCAKVQSLFVSKEGDVYVNGTGRVAKLVVGDVYDVKGHSIGQNGEIRNSESDLIGLVEPVEPDSYASDYGPLPSVDFLSGLTCRLDGLIYDADGNPLGIVTEGNPQELQHTVLDDDGQFLNDYGEIIGKAVVHPDACYLTSDDWLGTHILSSVPFIPKHSHVGVYPPKGVDPKVVLIDQAKLGSRSQIHEFDELSDKMRDRLAETVNPSGRNLGKFDHKVICIIENISEEWMNLLYNLWDVTPNLARIHYERTEVEHSEPDDSCRHCRLVGEKFGSIRGYIQYSDDVLEIGSRYNPRNHLKSFPTRRAGSRRDVVPWSTKISYYWVHSGLLLLLVDSPLDTKYLGDSFPHVRPHLRFPAPESPGQSVQLPQLFGTSTFSILEVLKRAFSEEDFIYDIFALSSWSRFLIPDFLYLLTLSVCHANSKHLGNDIRRISFVEIRNPDLTTSDKLHDRREDLHYLKSAIRAIRSCIVGDTALLRRRVLTKWNDKMREKCDSILEDTSLVESNLSETFTLLISSLSAKDSYTSLQQSRRGTLVTALAFIYVPLSFVTGIFGMNLKSVNGSPLPFWVCFVALAIVIAATGIIFGSYKWWEYHKRQRQNNERYKMA